MARPQNLRPKFPIPLIIWGAIRYKGKSHLIFTGGTTDSLKYQEIFYILEHPLQNFIHLDLYFNTLSDKKINLEKINGMLFNSLSTPRI